MLTLTQEVQLDQILATGNVVTLVHFFSYKTYVMREGQTLMRDSWREAPGHIVCMPGMTEFHATRGHPAYLRTEEVRAVTCPACMNTPEYAHRVDELKGLKVVK